jgi:hypothetical protein
MNYVIIEHGIIWKVTDNGGLLDISMIQASAAAGLGLKA